MNLKTKLTKNELVAALTEANRLLGLATATIQRLQGTTVMSPYHIPKDVVKAYFAAHDGNPADRSPAAIRNWATAHNPGDPSPASQGESS